MSTHSKGKSVVKSISLDPHLYSESSDRAEALRFKSFSAYVQRLIEKDLDSGGPMVLSESGASYGQKSEGKVREKRGLAKSL